MRRFWCPGPGSNRHGAFAPRDFKSLVSTNFTTRARRKDSAPLARLLLPVHGRTPMLRVHRLGAGTGRRAGFRFQCPRGVGVRLPP